MCFFMKKDEKFIIPSIDLLDGKIVRLLKGDYNKKTIYEIDILDLLEKYKKFHNLHIVDLNGAKGFGINFEIISKIRANFQGKIQVGGGVRSLEIVDKMINEIKIDRVVLGTIAIEDFNLTRSIFDKFGDEKIVLAIDCSFENGSYIPKINGWSKGNTNNKDLFTILDNYKDIARYILVTDISFDGTMRGVNKELYQLIKEKFSNFLLQSSGGVSSSLDIEKLKEVSDFAIVGKALYENLFNHLCC